ncbi:MAG: 3-deoxy-manno-octulosonate cytidylyltransferase, partial [Gammaproteobacteria bacterium]
MNVLGIIPARYGSSRLPGKPLIKVKGKTIIQRVYERAVMSDVLYKVVVATDDVRIYNHVRKFGGEAIMTKQVHCSGTMRCGEVIESIPDADIIINIQGDEPLINPGEISRLGRFLLEDS